MESLPRAIPYTSVLLDNILISGVTNKGHLQNLGEVTIESVSRKLDYGSQCRYIQTYSRVYGLSY